MGILAKQTGWSREEKLLWELANTINKINISNSNITTTSTTTSI